MDIKEIRWEVEKQILLDRLESILTMVYVVQNYWAYFGLYPSSFVFYIPDDG
jgi:hypothetical protein